MVSYLPRHFDLRSYKLALILLWLVITGGYAGWSHPAFLLANLAFLTTLGAIYFILIRHTGPDAVEIALLIFIGAIIISTVATQEWHGALRVTIWLGYLGVYRLSKAWSDSTIHRAARWSLIPYALTCFFPWENSNIIAFNLLSLALLTNLGILGWVGIGMIYLGSMGGLLSTGVGVAIFTKRPKLLWVGLGALTLAGWIIEPASYAIRLSFWVDAWRGFLLSPLWGIGPGQYHTLIGGWMHAHNIVATTAAEMGLIGLAALGWLAWVIARGFHTLPTWAAALVAAYATWSMVDEPLQIFGAGFIFFIALSRTKGGEKTYGESSHQYDEIG